MSMAASPGTAYSSSNQRPRSTSRQRSEQKGRWAPSASSRGLRHVGHVPRRARPRVPPAAGPSDVTYFASEVDEAFAGEDVEGSDFPAVFCSAGDDADSWAPSPAFPFLPAAGVPARL